MHYSFDESNYRKKIFLFLAPVLLSIQFWEIPTSFGNNICSSSFEPPLVIMCDYLGGFWACVYVRSSSYLNQRHRFAFPHHPCSAWNYRPLLRRLWNQTVVASSETLADTCWNLKCCCLFVLFSYARQQFSCICRFLGYSNPSLHKYCCHNLKKN